MIYVEIPSPQLAMLCSLAIFFIDSWCFLQLPVEFCSRSNYFDDLCSIVFFFAEFTDILIV